MPGSESADCSSAVEATNTSSRIMCRLFYTRPTALLRTRSRNCTTRSRVLKQPASELTLIQAGVAAVRGQQVVVGAFLDDPSMLHHQDEIGVPDRREAVGDDEGGSALHRIGHRRLDQDLGARVHAAGGLVENEDRRVGEK